MTCDNCDKEGDRAYTLQAHIGETDANVEMSFCSTECLEAWVAPDPRPAAATDGGRRSP